MGNSVRQYAVVLLFDSETDRKAVALSETHLPMAKDKSFRLDVVRAIPHLSHLHVMLDDEGAERAKDELDRIAAMSGLPPAGVFEELRVTYDTWLFWTTPLTPELKAQHEAVVAAVAPLRRGKVPVNWKMSELKARMHEEHGFPNVLEAFDPHVTIQILQEKFRTLQPRCLERLWTAESLSLVRTGRFASATEIVHDAFFDP